MIGLGLFFAHLSSAGLSASDTAPGLVAKVGLSYQLSSSLAAFAEWKFNHASFGFSSGGMSFGSDYTANIAAFGLAYTFGD